MIANDDKDDNGDVDNDDGDDFGTHQYSRDWDAMYCSSRYLDVSIVVKVNPIRNNKKPDVQITARTGMHKT